MKNKEQQIMLTADFETTVNKDKPEIYSWAVGYKEKQENIKPQKIFKGMYVNYDINVKSFINFLENLKMRDYTMFFNNGSGFDCHFLVPALIENKYNYIPSFYVFLSYEDVQSTYLKNRFKKIENYLKEKKEKSGMVWTKSKFNRLLEKYWNKLVPFEFFIIANDSHKILEILIGMKNKYSGKNVYEQKIYVIRIWCSYQIYKTSILKMGNLLNKKYKNDLYTKKDLKGGYTKINKYKFLKELENDGNQLKYLLQDVFILYSFLNEMKKLLIFRYWRLTIASTSFEMWKRITQISLIEEEIKIGNVFWKIKEDNFKIYFLTSNPKNPLTSGQVMKWILNQWTPNKWLKEEISENLSYYSVLHQYYKGGIVHLNEEYRGKIMKNITVVDINSSYPSVMKSNNMLPIGEPFLGDKKSYPFKFYKLIPINPNKLPKNKKGLPFIYTKTGKDYREYNKKLSIDKIYRFCEIEKKNIFKYYLKGLKENIDYKLEIEFSFKQKPIKYFFKDFIKTQNDLKIDSTDELMKNLAKLFMNSLYGKFGSKIDRDSRYYDIKNNDWTHYKEILEPKYYLPWSISITALARMKLVDAVDENYHNFIYCDTDSIHIKNFKKENFLNMEIDDKKLGAWKIEDSGIIGIYRRAKQYIFFNDNEVLKAVFAGISFKELDKEFNTTILKQLRPLNYLKGKIVNYQKRGKRKSTGIIIESGLEKEIPPIWSKKYPKLSEQIYYKESHFKDSIQILEKRRNNAYENRS